MRYSSDGEVAWTKIYNGPGQANGTSLDSGRAIALDTADNVYVAGVLMSATASDYFTMKFSPDGAVLWQQRYTGSSKISDNSADEPVGIAVTASRVIVSGMAVTDTGALQITTLLYDLNGNC